jgi:hypothetical protein
MGLPPPIFRDITTAEQKFAGMVQNFIGSYDPQLQPVVGRITRTWAKEWSNMALPTLFPPAGGGLSEFLAELHQQTYHKFYYSIHRERILERHKRNYRRRKALAQQQQPLQRPRRTYTRRNGQPPTTDA